MRRLFTDDSLEDFLKHNSERFQMRPSDKVWKGIQDNLKRRRRRIGWFTGLFLLCTSTGAYFLAQQESELALNSSVTTGGRTSTPPATGIASNELTPANKIAAGQTTTQNIQVTGAASNVEASASSLLTNGMAMAATPRTAGTHVAVRHSRGNQLSAGVRRGTTAATQAQPADVSLFDNGSDESRMTEASLEAPVTASKPNLLAPVPTNESPVTAQLKNNKSRMSFQFFFTPTVSYRNLSENKDYTSAVPQASADPSAAPLYNINDAVTHKPNIGLEVGLTAKYPLSRIVKLQGGLQFNMSRYDVQAFDNPQSEPAMIALRGGGAQMSQTNYSNMEGAGNDKDWLQNMYFQVSAPIGVELKLAGNDRTQFGIASTIQPTYILSDRVYMLSTDYKSYAEVPWLIRRWNVNTALSTYVGYSTGKLAWQIGPQVRYQLFSSFMSKYPVKENLFDFGLRVGVSLNQKH